MSNNKSKIQCGISFPCTMQAKNDPGLVVRFSEWGTGHIVSGEMLVQIWCSNNQKHMWHGQKRGDIVRHVIMDKFEAFKPERVKATDALSRAASEIYKLAESHQEGAEMDAGFDAGEFSGPAHGEAEAEEQDEIARRYGFKHSHALYAAIAARTTGKFMFFRFPPCMSTDDYEMDSVHGKAANR